jgi:hypothetical protein
MRFDPAVLPCKIIHQCGGFAVAEAEGGGLLQRFKSKTTPKS